MKNVKVLAPDEIDAWVQGLWKTEEFRKSHSSNGYIGKLIKRLAKYPLAIFEMTAPEVEWSHFTTWMGGIALREESYDNPVVHDLYYLHEFWHAATLTYDPSMSSARWFCKMTENEMFSSLHSEAYVYFIFPELRERSFPFEIWVDRYMKQTAQGVTPDYGSHTSLDMPSLRTKLPAPALGRHEGFTHYKYLFNFLLARRVETMQVRNPFDLCALQIYYYAEQNVQWFNVWRDSWRDVEVHMRDMRALSDQGEVTRAVDMHRRFYDEAIESGEEILFALQAIRFSQIVKDNKKRQGNAELFES